MGESKEEEASPEAPPIATLNDTSDGESESAVPSEDASEAGSSANRRASSTSRQLTLRLKAQQGQAIAKQRELARQKLAEQKQALAEHRRLDEEMNKVERRLEGIEREFRKLIGTVRVKPLGRDRFYNRVWWFDGCGSSSLIGGGGAVQYGTGRIFVQGPSSFDQEILDRRDDEESDVQTRRVEEESEDGVLASGEWGVYTELEDVRSLRPFISVSELMNGAIPRSKLLLPGSILKALESSP